ncbi:MAG: hypothetical protein ACTSRA_11030 [Promethearchaeota archaeon]
MNFHVARKSTRIAMIKRIHLSFRETCNIATIRIIPTNFLILDDIFSIIFIMSAVKTKMLVRSFWALRNFRCGIIKYVKFLHVSLKSRTVMMMLGSGMVFKIPVNR